MKYLLFLSIFSCVAVASAQQTWDGFKPAAEVQVGPSDFINNAVVMIKHVGGMSIEYKDTAEIVDVETVEKITNKKKLTHTFNINEPNKNMRNIQIETCRSQGLKFCPVFSVSGISTGFFDKGSYLNMCRHSFHNWLVLASKANNRALDTLSPPMIIFSKDKEVLYNSALVSREQLIKVSYLNLDDRLNNELYGKPDKSNKLSNNMSLSDYIHLESPVAVAPSYEVSFVTDFNQMIQGARIYQAGYPAATNYFSNGKADAPGFELVVSTGPILATSTKQQAVKVGAMTAGGMSGGPILLEDGRVIGLVCNGKTPTVDQPNSGATTSIVIDRNALEKLWSTLVY